MIYHVLPGDAQVAEFKQTGIQGELIICREVLVAGPIDAEDLDRFWQQRATFIANGYGEDEIDYHEKVADPLSRLTEITDTDEVNLWFEYELFCSVNMWFCLSLIEPTGVATYRIEPFGLDESTRWEGFGGFTADKMREAYEHRRKFTDAEVKLGADLWQAYRMRSHRRLKELVSGEHPSFPYLEEVVAAALEQDIRPLEALRKIAAQGETDFGRIFTEFRKSEGVYGYGDTQVRDLLAQIFT